VCAALLDRVKLWNEGKIDELWSEARKLYPGGDRAIKPSSLASNIRRATECAQDARYGKAVAALLSLGTCPMNADTLKEMRTKHPEADLPTLPSGSLPEAVRFDVDLVSVQQLLSTEKAHGYAHAAESKGECALPESDACFYHASCQ